MESQNANNQQISENRDFKCKQQEDWLPWWLSSKNPPAMQETQVQSLGQEDPLEKKTATQSNTLAWETPWTQESGRLQSSGLQKSQTRLSN